MNNILETHTTKEAILREFSWLNDPKSWALEAGVLSMVPNTKTDFFRSPLGEIRDSACLLSKPVSGDFTVIAHTRAKLVGFGDASAVTVRESAGKWAKLCLERSPIGDINAVSVVTDGFSDDANSELLGGPEAWLRITRRGDLFGMHHSIDGETWRFVRAFALDVPAKVDVGIHAQAPYAEGCSVEFDYFEIRDTAVQDFRSGE
jgi:regulation of enolase protein 1 (concanavalin A-like superfamily)